ncbi:MAG TPA: thioredoxin family protein, partial [Acetobacteraceae bacterium]|nr:thioredoxin family protein [Acetobacteraceae bacterium]
WRILGLAVLGGLILNLMPCVFPVLAMKIAGLAALPDSGRRSARLHGFSYAAGVLACFAALAGVMLALRAAGAAAGWGFQFQSPAFVAAMCALLFAVGLNLSGVFAFGARFAGTGQALAMRQGHAGSFFTGLLAVLVATPCTAPFMGAALAAALTAPAAVTLAVFLALGVGLALPYVVLTAVPGLARALPRPGRWMDVLKQALAFPMYASSVWLLWVISQEAGPDGVLATGAVLVLVGFAAWVAGTAQRATGRGRRLGQGAGVVAVLAMAGVFAGFAAHPAVPPAASRHAGQVAYSPARLAALRAAGQPVFVNVTAAWCVTCLVNERVALDRPAVRAAFAARHIAYMVADWTRQDPVVTALLRAHGRVGVPLYLFYPAGGGTAVTLPQLLTPGIVIDAIRRGNT